MVPLAVALAALRAGGSLDEYRASRALDGLDDEQRVEQVAEQVVRAAASGAWSSCPDRNRWTRGRTVVWPSSMTDEQLAEATLRSASSGAWSTCPPPSIVVDGHRVRIPAGYRRRR